MKLLIVACLLALSYGTVYFSEEFTDDWETRWVNPSVSDLGKFELSAGKWFVDAQKDKGIRTSTNLKHYLLSTKFPGFSNHGKSLVIQYTVKNEQELDCGGAYIKVLKEGLDPAHYNKETPYLVMFGPDICGVDKKTHVILTYKDEGFLIKNKLRTEDDNLTHLYTLIINPDNTFEVLIDNKQVHAGQIADNFDMVPPAEIDDPEAKKPEDWEENPTILDENDKKPDNWDDIPEFIPDESASKPDDWDDEVDGVWRPPRRRNPEFKGEWQQKKIPNPNYKGPWKAPKVPNPEHVANINLYEMDRIGGVGIEIWQVTAGTIFDNFFIGDDVDEAKKFARKTFSYRKEKEPEAKKKFDESEREKNKVSEEEEEGEDEEFEDVDRKVDL